MIQRALRNHGWPVLVALTQHRRMQSPPAPRVARACGPVSVAQVYSREAMKTRIASLNANKGGHDADRRRGLLAWVGHHGPSLLFLQEPCHASTQPVPEIGDLKLVVGNSRVAAYALPSQEVSAQQVEERWLCVRLSGRAVHGVYFPATKEEAKDRVAMLDRLAAAVRAEPALSHVIVGDFNFGPTLADGLANGKPSRWTSKRERVALKALLSAAGLEDATRDVEEPHRFTIERTIGKTLSRFRCDLALVDRRLAEAGAVKVKVDHSVRSGEAAFTDHSALVLDLGEALAA